MCQQERYDPIVPPEARLYPFKEAVTHDDENDAADASNVEGEERDRGHVTVVEMDFRGELKR